MRNSGFYRRFRRLDLRRPLSKETVKFAILLIIVIGIPAIVIASNPEIMQTLKDPKKMENFLLSYKGHSFIIYVIFQILQVVITVIPGQVVQVAAGFLFGLATALILSIIGIGIGTIISFYLAKLLGRDFFKSKLGVYKFEQYKRLLESRKGLVAIFILYLIPGLPKDVISYLAGIAEIRLLPFFCVSMAGRIPALFFSILTGYFLVKNSWVPLCIVVGFVTILLVIILIKHKKIIKYLFGGR